MNQLPFHGTGMPSSSLGHQSFRPSDFWSPGLKSAALGLSGLQASTELTSSIPESSCAVGLWWDFLASVIVSQVP